MAQARDKDFIINISKLTRAVNQRGFGLIMIYSLEKDSPYQLYESLPAVGEQFSVLSNTYKIASRIFGQNPKPQQIAIIGNTDLEEKEGTKGVFNIMVDAKFEAGDQVNINGKIYNCVSEAANDGKDEFLAGEIVQEIEELTKLISKYENNFDVTSTGDAIVLTQIIAGVGELPVVRVNGSGQLSVITTTPPVLPTGMIAYLNQIREINADPFFLVCSDNSDDTLVKLSEWVDTQEMMYFMTTQNINAPKLVKSENTVVAYHDDPSAFLGEGLASVLTTKTVGGVSAKFKAIKGVKACNITATQLSNLHKSNGFTYIEKAGLLQTTEGKTTSGEWIDVVMGAFWIQFKMEEGIIYLAVNTDKIGYNNQDISKMVAVCNDVLDKAARRQKIVLINSFDIPQYKITYIPREDVDPNDVANRYYDGIEWVAKLDGAIHKATVSGVLTY